jgi:hypothetical protein
LKVPLLATLLVSGADPDWMVGVTHDLSRDALLERWAISPENVQTRSMMLVALLSFALAYGGAALLVVSWDEDGVRGAVRRALPPRPSAQAGSVPARACASSRCEGTGTFHRYFD